MVSCLEETPEMEVVHSLEELAVSCKGVSTLDSNEKQSKEHPEDCAHEKLKQSEDSKAGKKKANVKTQMNATPDRCPSKRGRKRKYVAVLSQDLVGDVSASNENEVKEETDQDEGGSRKAADIQQVVKRGRKRTIVAEEENPENPENGHEPEESEATPTPKRRGRKAKTVDTRDAITPTQMKENIICGVCQKEVADSSFDHHRYAVHLGLARPEGCSQEFTKAEEKKEYRIVLEQMKKINCPKCPSSFTTVAGYIYHTGRCGLDAQGIEKKHQQCTLCGKKVLAFRAHMKVHEKAAAKAQTEENEYVLGTCSARKSKRAAAVKTATILNEFQEELSEAGSKKQVRKLTKLFVEPSSIKVTNTIIAVWRREMKEGAKAYCRFPGCSFTSDVLDDLKAHHVECVIGASLGTFSCIKCPFRCSERGDMENHIIDSHATEADANFEMGSGSDDDVDDGDLDDDREVISSTISNSRKIGKMYGLSATDVLQLTMQLTSPLIPQLLAKYHKRHFSWHMKLYDELRSWPRKLVDSIVDYIPSWVESVPFTRRTVSACTPYPPVVNVTYERLPRFHSKLHGDDTPIFFCGGPVQCAAWCPMPSTGPQFTGGRHQYLAVFAQKESEFKRIVAAKSPFRSNNMIQIWSCGPLNNSQAASVAPKMEFNVAHTFGRVWALEWCPSGCYDDARLGLLGAACSDATVRLFCIPRPSTLIGDSDGAISCSIEPVLTLSLNMSEQSECTSLHWDCTKDHRYVVAGYANGVIGLWDLHTKSPLLRNEKFIYPLWSFYGHHSVVTAVSLSPHHNDGRFIASASMDRCLKLWDRFDPRVPVCCTRRSRITHFRWRRHWPGVLINIDDVFAIFRCYTCFYDFGYTGNQNSLLPQNSVVWHSTENEYLDLVAHCTSAGEIVVYSPHMALMEPNDRILRRSRYVALRTDLVDVSVQAEDPRLNTYNKKSYQNSKKTPQVAREIVKKEKKEYSLIFNDIITVPSMGKQSQARNLVSDIMDICLPNDKPVASIKKILYNPNVECHTWMCVCGENGLVQLLRIDSIAPPKATDLYMHELESK